MTWEVADEILKLLKELSKLALIGILLSRERPAPIVWLGAGLVLAGALLAAW